MEIKWIVLQLAAILVLLSATDFVHCANMTIIDITHEYNNDTMPSYGSKKGIGSILSILYDQRQGSKTTNSLLTMQVHCGTHIDAPSHVYVDFLTQGFDVNTVDLQKLNGPAIVVDVPRDKNITADVMKGLNIQRGVERVLFRTLNTDRKLMTTKEFDSSYVGFTQDGAQYVMDNTDIKLVGVDYLSAASADNVLGPHLVFMKDRIVVPVEGLKLDEPEANVEYTLHCLPLRLHADASPTRCILTK